MIQKQQFQMTKIQIQKFEQALKEFDLRRSAHPGIHPRLIKAQRDALESQLQSLREELKGYKRLRRGHQGRTKMS